MIRGVTRNEAETMIVNGFIEAFTNELPLEYAVELNRLIQLEMEGSVGQLCRSPVSPWSNPLFRVSPTGCASGGDPLSRPTRGRPCRARTARSGAAAPHAAPAAPT